MPDPTARLIPTWHWGDHVEVYREASKAPRWVRCRGLLRDPCDVAGCKRFIVAGEWYVRHPFLGVVCADCARRFGAIEPTTAR